MNLILYKPNYKLTKYVLKSISLLGISYLAETENFFTENTVDKTKR